MAVISKHGKAKHFVLKIKSINRRIKFVLYQFFFNEALKSHLERKDFLKIPHIFIYHGISSCHIFTKTENLTLSQVMT